MEICRYFHNVLWQVFSTSLPNASFVMKVTDSVGRRPSMEVAFNGVPCGTPDDGSQATQFA